MLPAVGVYAVRVRLFETAAATPTASANATPSASPNPNPGANATANADLPATVTYVPPRLSAALPGAANLGLNPTFRDDAHAGSGREPLMLEVHLLDVDEDLYGRTLRVEFIHRLRDERRFPNVDALKEQIARDVASARRLLGA